MITKGIIDSHAHIYDPAFEDKAALLERARANGVSAVVMPNVDVETFSALSALAIAHPGYLYMTVGLHPTEVNEHWREQLATLKEQGEGLRKQIVAIGEIGLDFYWSKDFAKEQEDALRQQLDWAMEWALPVILHVRSSFRELFAILDEAKYSKLKGVFHSFTGSEEELKRALSYEGMMIGVNGILTFKNSQLRDYISQVPLDRLLVETDSPYLAPVPFRGRQNEPSYIVHTVSELARSYGLDEKKIIQHTRENTIRLFSL